MGIEIKTRTGRPSGALEYSGEYFYHRQLVNRIRDHLLTYRHSWLERDDTLNAGVNQLKICWADNRPAYEFYWADYINGGPNDFHELFFVDFEEFYGMSDALRDQFIAEALKLWDGIFVETQHELWTAEEFIGAANNLYRDLIRLKKQFLSSAKS